MSSGKTMPEGYKPRAPDPLFRRPWALWGAVVLSLTWKRMPQNGHISIPRSRSSGVPPPLIKISGPRWCRQFSDPFWVGYLHPAFSGLSSLGLLDPRLQAGTP